MNGTAATPQQGCLTFITRSHHRRAMRRWNRGGRDTADDDGPIHPAAPLFHGTFLRQSLPFLLMTALGGLVAGVLLQGMRGVLETMPGLLVLVPAMIGLRGNISSSLGARLGSAIHLGLVGSTAGGTRLRDVLRNRELVENVNGSLALSVIMPAIAALAAYGTSRIFGLAIIGLGPLFLIAVASGLASGVILAGITVAIVLVAHRRGLDPDNVTGPFLATVGDVLTLLILLGMATAVAGATGITGGGSA